jgi:toxin YhaV
VYGWVNDPTTLRAYGTKTDAYLVFKKMLESGRVPNDWDELIAESKRLS